MLSDWSNLHVNDSANESENKDNFDKTSNITDSTHYFYLSEDKTTK